MDLNNERRLNPLSMGTAPVWGQQLKSPCEAHGMVRWGSPETPSHKQMIMKYIIEFLSFAVLTLLCLYSFTILMVMI